MRLHARHLLRLLPVAAICALAILIAPATVFGDPSPSPEPAPEATERYIVVLEDDVNHPGRVAQRHAINRDADLSNVYKTALKGYAAEMTPADKEAVEADPAVDYVERDVVVEIASQPAQETPTGVNRIFAPSNSTLDIDGIDDVQVNADVAILDTGVDYDHPDLRVVERTNCDTASNLCVDDSGDDNHGHGTHVAGIVGAVDNGIGVVGVAPGARIWGVKVVGSSEGYIAQIIAGVDWVTAHAGQIEVANMSLTLLEPSATLQDAVATSVAAGVVYVVAAGNYPGGEDASTWEPANYDEDVITVSAIADFDGLPGGLLGNSECYETDNPIPRQDLDDSMATYSKWGTVVDITAPGTCIKSTFKHGRYGVLSGTSMAAPHVAGAAAILASKDNPSNYGDVWEIMAELIVEGNDDWTPDDDGDSVQEPLLDVGNESVFKVSSPGSVGSIGVTSDNTYDLDIFARNGNNEIWRKAYRSNHWGNWSSSALPNSGEYAVGAPAVISRRSDSTDLFVKNNYGGVVFRNKWEGTWSSWYPIYPPDNKPILNSPAATNRPDIYDGLTMLVRGHDGNVYLKNYWESIPGGWSPWENLGAPAAGTASSPAITMHDETWLHVAVRGADGAIYDKAWGTGEQKWSGWVNLGGGFTSAPAMTTSRSGDEMYLFGVKTDGKLWMRKAVKGVSGWSEWESLGGSWVADPAATSRESHGVSVFGVGLDNKIQERRYTYGGWTNWMRVDDDCPPEACSWDPGGPGTGHIQSVEANDLVTVDSTGTANVFPGYGEGFDLEDPVTSLEGDLDPALLDGKGHYVVDVADVNDDDNSDLITVKDEGKVLVHLGEEDRTFAAATDTGISLPPAMNEAGKNEPIAVADLTGDGFDDLLAYLGNSATNRFALYKGKEDGKFNTTAVESITTAPVSAVQGGSYNFLDAVDVDGDGLADLVATSSSAVYVYKGSADGKLATAALASTIDLSLSDGSGQEAIGLGDVSGDGRADLLTIDLSGNLKLYAGKSDGTFAAAASAYASTVDSDTLDNEGEELLGLLDFNGDGRADLVSTADGDLLAYAAKTDSTFAAPIASEGEIESIRDSRLGHEFALTKPLLKRPRCALEGCLWPPSRPDESDVDGDGRSDLVTLHTNGKALVYTGTALGIADKDPVSSFAGSMDAALYDDEGRYMIDVADVGGDGKGDLITEADDGDVEVFAGKSNATFGSAIAALGAEEGLQDVEPIALADVTGDYRADLVRFATVEEEGTILVSPGQADGTFSAEEQEASLVGEVDSALLDGSGHYFLDAIDVDRDGLADLVAMTTAGQVRVYRGQIDGTFASSAGAAATIDPIMDDGSGHEPIGLGDTNADGRADLLTLDPEGKLKLHKGKADATFATGTAGPYGVETIDSSLLDGTGEELIGLLDYNRDHRADLISLRHNGVLRSFFATTSGIFDFPTTREESIPTHRFASAPGNEIVAEKPFLRRTGCTAGGCEWPPIAPEPPTEPGEPTPTDWTESPVGEAQSSYEDAWCPSGEDCLAAGVSVSDAGVSRAQISQSLGMSYWGPLWTMDSSEADSSELSGITCASGSEDCFAVGSYDDGGGTVKALILSGASTSWTDAKAPVPAGAKSSQLNDVSCYSASVCAAVGSYVDSAGAKRTLALHWDGSAWKVKSTPGTGTIYLSPSGTASSTASELTDVSCRAASTCTAVGTFLVSGSGTEKPLTLEFSSTNWWARTNPGISGYGARELAGIWCAEASVCTAVGSKVDSTGAQRTWAIEIYEGASGWSTLATPNANGENSLSAVWCAYETSCVAAGTSVGASGPRPLGVSWESNSSQETDYLLEMPTGARASALNGIACSAEAECQAVGNVSYGEHDLSTAAYGFDGAGSGWVTEFGGSYGTFGGGALRGISCPAAGDCLAVGDATYQAGPLDAAVGWFSGEGWTPSTTAEVSGPMLNDVSCTAINQCTAVGIKGGWPRETLAERWNGSTWTAQSTPNPSGGTGELGLAGVSCATSTSCVSVGSYVQKTPNRTLPIAQKWNGTAWSAMTVPAPGSLDAVLRDVSCTSASSCFAVGSSSPYISTAASLIEYWNGSAWAIQSVPAPAGAVRTELHGVSCTSATACTAVGNYLTSGSEARHTLIVRWNGTAWSLQTGAAPEGTVSAELQDVSCYSATGCVAVGTYEDSTSAPALAIRWDGSSWVAQSTPAPPSYSPRHRLESVSCASAEECTAVGVTEYEGGRGEHLALEGSG